MRSAARVASSGPRSRPRCRQLSAVRGGSRAEGSRVPIGHGGSRERASRAETIGPLPLRRLAGAHPQTAGAVFGKILGQPRFTWAEHGEALLRRRKPWYYEHEPRPGIAVIGARLSELIGR